MLFRSRRTTQARRACSLPFKPLLRLNHELVSYRAGELPAPVNFLTPRKISYRQMFKHTQITLHIWPKKKAPDGALDSSEDCVIEIFKSALWYGHPFGGHLPQPVVTVKGDEVFHVNEPLMVDQLDLRVWVGCLEKLWVMVGYNFDGLHSSAHAIHANARPKAMT